MGQTLTIFLSKLCSPNRSRSKNRVRKTHGVLVLLGPALGLVDGAAHWLPSHVAVLHQRLPTHLNIGIAS